MTDDELTAAVRKLRGRGFAPREIARALGVRPAAIADIVRTVAVERAADQPARITCFVSPGWDIGLSFEGHPEWPSDQAARPEASGLVAVLLAREESNDRVSVCSYLLDVYCLGVKNTAGPRRMRSRELAEFARAYFSPWEGSARTIPIDLARDLVFGAVDFARSLGFEPHRDFAQARRALEPWDGPSAISFGRDGVPCYTDGPYDDVEHVLETLGSVVGFGNFQFQVSTTLDQLHPASDRPSRRSLRHLPRSDAA